VLLRQHGEYGRAAALYEEALLLARDVGLTWVIGLCLRGIAALAGARRQPDRAARLLAAAQALLERIGVVLDATGRSEDAAIHADARAALGEDRFGAAWATGRALSLDDAIADALATTDEIAAGIGAPPDERLHPLPGGLTGREVEVLRLLAVGKTNPEIADALVISLNTVYRHVNHIFTKLAVSNRTEAATYAHQHGLLEPPARRPSPPR
jgi:serine/threonine-protein kinase PknK